MNEHCATCAAPPGLVLRFGVARFAHTPPLRTNPGGEDKPFICAVLEPTLKL
jgi:hypothetical protein